MEILQKFIAASGYCSRRKAENLIMAGKVRINGKFARVGEMYKPGDKVSIGAKEISGEENKVYYKLNKPEGYVCTSRNFLGERNVFDLIDSKERLFVVGRLDKDSKGLIILTNDGDLANKVSHPRYECPKIYEVKVRGKRVIGSEVITAFKKGVNIGEEGVVRANKVRFLKDDLFLITLSTGSKRQIRRMFKAIKIHVADLKRLSIGGVSLGLIPEGQYKKMDKAEIGRLRKGK